MSKKEVELYCNISDILIHPSLREGLGIAALEGMASGLPLIAANINGIKDYTINLKTGININPLDIEEMKKAIIKLAKDKKLRVQMGIFNQSKVKEYDLEKTNKIMSEVYNEIFEE